MTDLPHVAGEVISYLEMCQAWSASLQKGMNFRLRPDRSVILMSRRSNAPYRDQIEEDGKVLIYEGDQPRSSPNGKLTQNGLFEEAAKRAKDGKCSPEVVAVYEKIHAGVWAFNGFFLLTDAWNESDGRRGVFKFRLELIQSEDQSIQKPADSLTHNRVIPSAVKLEVWQRDKGQCVLCGSGENLHFDHDLPFSKGGSSLTAANIRLLCVKHNLSKGAKIQ
jgi:hypothetical protein